MSRSDAERWRRVRDILHQALELPAEKRGAYLAGACGDESVLRAEVESLLAASEKSMVMDGPDLTLTGEQINPSERLHPGQVISHYRTVEKIGKGGMGEVYKATDTLLGRTVALKVITDPDKDRRRRFAREAKAASALNHPNIVTIYEFNSENGVDFIAMEYVEGATLGNLLTQPLEKLLGYARQAAAAITCAHSAGIVHRDLKPNNIMVTPEGLAKVLDFGLAKHEDPARDPEATRSMDLTRGGDLIGTPAYISPEQILGEPVGPAADIFCFGIILYEMACGRRPFGGNTALAMLDSVVHKDPPALSSMNRGIPSELANLIEKCLKKSPAERPASMTDVAAALTDVAAALTDVAAALTDVAATLKPLPANRQQPKPLNRRRWIGAAAGLVLAASAALYFGRGAVLVPLPAPALTYTIEAQKPGEDKPYIASASDTFEAFWKFRLHLQPPPSGFLYLVNQGPGQDGAEQWWVLYSAAVAPEREVVTGWYVFDQNPGTERLWVVWAVKPIDELSQPGKVEDVSRATRIRERLSTLESQKQSTASATSLELRHR